MKEINIIAAISKNRIMGNKGNLPWHISEDLIHFKELTKNGIVIMGRKTFESTGILKDRFNIVLSSQNLEGSIVNLPNFITKSSLQDAIEFAQKNKEYGSQIWIIGGSQVYNMALSLELVNKIYLTEIDYEVSGDVVFPILGDEWKLNTSSKRTIKIGEISLKYSFNVYSK